MKKTYSTPEIQLHGMNTSEAFMVMSAGTDNNYGITTGGNGGNASQNGNPTPDARELIEQQDTENDWD